MSAQRLRLAAYAVCLQEDRLLLARFVSPDGTKRYWTLPGGKVEHSEDPYDAVVREVREETGYQVEVERLLGVGSRCHEAEWNTTEETELHRVSVYYRVQVTGGELRDETGGSTDLAEWIPLERVPELERAVIIDTALKLERERPVGGHVESLPVSGLRRL